jgi:hypothetical protein
MSVNAFCKDTKFAWVTGATGPHEFGDDLMIAKRAQADTLRRRYQEAVAYLKKSSEPYKRLKAMLAVPHALHDGISPLEKWWDQLLEERLARIVAAPEAERNAILQFG